MAFSLANLASDLLTLLCFVGLAFCVLIVVKEPKSRGYRGSASSTVRRPPGHGATGEPK